MLVVVVVVVVVVGLAVVGGGKGLFGEDKRQLAVMKDDSIKLISLIRHTLAKDCGEGGKERKRVDSAHC